MTARLVLVAAIFAVVGAAGCHVPVAASAPQRPTTAGAGSWRFSGHVEAPVIDLLGTVASEPSAASPSRYPWADWPAFEMEVAYGVGERVDVEAGAQGVLYLVVPIPHAAFAGIRHHAYDGDTIDLGWFSRAGYGGLLADSNEFQYEGSAVRVPYASAGLASRMTWREVRPGLSVAAHPMWVMPEINGPKVDDLFAIATTATLSVDYRGVTPFVSGGLIYSQNARGTSPLWSAGLAWDL